MEFLRECDIAEKMLVTMLPSHASQVSMQPPHAMAATTPYASALLKVATGGGKASRLVTARRAQSVR